MRSLLIQALHTLESQLLKWNDQNVQYDTGRFIEIVQEFHQHSASVARLMPLLAEHGHFHAKNKLCVLFLPTFLRTGKLNICLQHGFESIRVLTAQSDLFDIEILENVSELELQDKCNICAKLFSNSVNRGERLALRVEELFSKFPRLKVLKIRGFKYPKILLEQVVRNFPELRELDFFRDWLTSDCVEQLGRLEQLNHLHFYSMHIFDKLLNDQRFVSENATSPVVVDDIRLTNNETKKLECVINNLPNSVALSCSRVAMSDAARILQLCESRSIFLKSFYILFRDGSHYNFEESREVFPNIKTLRLCDSSLESVTDRALGKFTNLRDLAISDCPTSPSLGVIGSNLRQLEVWMLKLQSRELIVMSEQCPNVTYLHIGGYEYTETPAVVGESVSLVPGLFPQLHTLIIYLNNLSGLHLFMNVSSKLTRLFAFDYFNPVGNTSVNGGVIETLTTKPGAWPRLEIFHVSNITYNRSQAIKLVEALPSLQYILMKVPKCEDGRSFASSRGQIVRLFKCPELHILPAESEFYTWEDRWFSGPTY